MRKIILLLIFFSMNAYSVTTYYVDSSVNAQILVINGKEFIAKSYCHDFQFGDGIVFISGGIDCPCEEAEIFNLNNKQACEVWCRS